MTASVEITSLANPAQPVSRTVALPAHLPEVDVTLSLPRHANTSHVASDRWDVSCDALVNGQSVYSSSLYSNEDKICITPQDNDDEFVVYTNAQSFQGDVVICPEARDECSVVPDLELQTLVLIYLQIPLQVEI